MKRFMVILLAGLVLGSGVRVGPAGAAETPDDQWWSYCTMSIGTGSSKQGYFSRLFRGRVHNTLEDTRPFGTGPMADYDVRERLTAGFKALGHPTAHKLDSRCWTMPQRDYLETTMRPDMYDRFNDGRPMFEFDFDPLSGAVTNVSPMSNPRQRSAAPTKAAAQSSSGSGLVVTPGETPAEKAARIASEDRMEAMRVAEVKRQADLKRDRARYLAEEAAAMEAWKRRPKAPACGGSTGRGCPASKQ